jgi:hypothetical protein
MLLEKIQMLPDSSRPSQESVHGNASLRARLRKLPSGIVRRDLPARSREIP